MSCSRGCCATPKEHWRSVSFSASATPTRNPSVGALEAKEKRWEKDISAVNQMKRDGIVPKQVDGADKWLATAQDKIEIEHFHKYNNLEAVKEVTEELNTPKTMEEVKKIRDENTKILKDVL